MNGGVKYHLDAFKEEGSLRGTYAALSAIVDMPFSTEVLLKYLRFRKNNIESPSARQDGKVELKKRTQ